MFGFGKPRINDPYNTMGTAAPKPAKAPAARGKRSGIPGDFPDLPPCRHVTGVSRAAARAIARDYPHTGRYDSVTFTGSQVRAMADRARARGDNAAAGELARAADDAAKYPTGEVGFLKSS